MLHELIHQSMQVPRLLLMWTYVLLRAGNILRRCCGYFASCIVGPAVRIAAMAIHVSTTPLAVVVLMPLEEL